jgi:hypothetical protein
MKKILTLIGFIALMQAQFAWANAAVGESSTTPCTAINGSTAAAETPITPNPDPSTSGSGATR